MFLLPFLMYYIISFQKKQKKDIQNKRGLLAPQVGRERRKGIETRFISKDKMKHCEL